MFSRKNKIRKKSKVLSEDERLVKMANNQVFLFFLKIYHRRLQTKIILSNTGEPFWTINCLSILFTEWTRGAA